MIRPPSRRFPQGDAPLLPLWEKGPGDEGSPVHHRANLNPNTNPAQRDEAPLTVSVGGQCLRDLRDPHFGRGVWGEGAFPD